LIFAEKPLSHAAFVPLPSFSVPTVPHALLAPNALHESAQQFERAKQTGPALQIPVQEYSFAPQSSPPPRTPQSGRFALSSSYEMQTLGSLTRPPSAPVLARSVAAGAGGGEEPPPPYVPEVPDEGPVEATVHAAIIIARPTNAPIRMDRR
jgi:hypothetical protein